MGLARLLGRPALTLAAWGARRTPLLQVKIPNAVRSGLVPVRPEVSLRSNWGRLALTFTGRANRPNGQIKFKCQRAQPTRGSERYERNANATRGESGKAASGGWRSDPHG